VHRPYSAWGGVLALAGFGLAVAAVSLWVADRSGGTAWAQDLGMPAAGTPGVVVSATPFGDSEVMICVFDGVRQRLAVYVADARRTRLKLLAVRDVSADWALTDYNNDAPLPKDVRARVEQWKESGGNKTVEERTQEPEPAPTSP